METFLFFLLLILVPAFAEGAKRSGASSAPPVIGINMDVSGGRDGEGAGSPGLRLSGSYVDAITSAGGIPVVLPPVLDEAAIRRQVALCDGFLFVGGGDLNPARYGEAPHSSVNLLHPRRESYDLALMNAVLKSRKPVLGVCLGCQEFNVSLGGSLVQDIASETSSTIDHHQGEGRHGFVHKVAVEPGTRLADLVGTTTLGVNSIHHQACDVPGSRLRVAARAPDGTVEGIELPGRRFAVGVQWHPEALTRHPEHLKIYRGLVEAAREKVGRRARSRR